MIYQRVQSVLFVIALLALATCSRATGLASNTVEFRSGDLELGGYLYKPQGDGPFPTLLYNHGSAKGFVNNQAFDAIGPVFVAHGWAFFAPYRRGQGLSSDAGPYIMDEIAAARARGGLAEAARTLTRLLATDHLDDQMAALAWLQKQDFVREGAIAAMGNSFGGIETVAGAARGGFCAAVDAAGGAESWDDAPDLRKLMLRSVETAAPPMLFFQAENDVSIAPSKELYAARQAVGLPAELLIYPAFGRSSSEGHSFPYRGVNIWQEDVLDFLDRHCQEGDTGAVN